MTKPARSNEQVQKIKQSILASALSILSAEGYSALTMRSIAARCGMTAANIYNYFHSKDDIYLELVIQGFEILDGALANALQKDAPPLKKLEAVLDAYYEFGKTYGEYYDIMFTLPTPKFKDFAGTHLEQKARREMDLSEKIISMLENIIREIVAINGEASHQEITLRLVEGWGALHGIVSLTRSRVLSYVAADIDEAYRRLRDDLIAMLVANI
jgi:AcrR family transcriptional regulator